MSTQYLSFFVMILSMALPKLGVTIGNDDLTTFLSVLISIGAGLFGMYRRYQQGGITVFGKRI